MSKFNPKIWYIFLQVHEEGEILNTLFLRYSAIFLFVLLIEN